jgi:uncharacterized DUF497 family protein
VSDPFDPSVVVPGYSELHEWYGVFPSFHDAYCAYTWRGQKRRLISLRRAHRTERRAYEKRP